MGHEETSHDNLVTNSFYPANINISEENVWLYYYFLIYNLVQLFYGRLTLNKCLKNLCQKVQWAKQYFHEICVAKSHISIRNLGCESDVLRRMWWYCVKGLRSMRAGGQTLNICLLKNRCREIFLKFWFKWEVVPQWSWRSYPHF